MRIHKHLSVVGALAVAASALMGTPAARAAANVVGPLSVTGNRIVDGNGQTLVLRGIHRNGSDAANPFFPSATELSYLGKGQPGSWGSNLVRVPVGSAQWTGLCASTISPQITPAAYQAAIDTEISTITSQGVVALLDLHASTAGCTSIARHAMPDYDVTRAFWLSAAARYADNPLVAFEPYNEPHWVTHDIWLNGTPDASVQDCEPANQALPQPQRAQSVATYLACAQIKPKYRAIGMQELYDLITTTAPNHLVVVDANGYATNVPPVPVTASRGELAYALHPYTCSVPNQPCDTTASAHANTSLLNAWVPFSHTVPVIADEFGWPVYATSGGAYIEGTAFYAETLAFLQQQSPQWGFAAFAWDGSTGGAFSMLSSTTTYTPNTTAQPVYDLLRSQ